MIPHRKHRLFNAVFVVYARHLLRRRFTAVHVHGLHHARDAVNGGPAIFVGNHTAWWDSIVLMWLSNYAFKPGPSDGYALMDDRNLRRFGFFRRLGVFGVALDDPADRAAVVPYAASLLDAPGRHVWLFPQGAERPVTEPLSFHAGAARLSAQSGVPVVPMALRYEHGRTPRPRAYVAFGPALPPPSDPEQGVADQEQAVTALLATLETEVRAAARRTGTIPALLGGEARRTGLAERILSAIVGGRRG